MDALLEAISENLFWVGIFLLLVLWSVGYTTRSILVGRARERTSREITAYVAEGSITAEEGERLLAAVARRNSEDDDDDDEEWC